MLSEREKIMIKQGQGFLLTFPSFIIMSFCVEKDDYKFYYLLLFSFRVAFSSFKLSSSNRRTSIQLCKVFSNINLEFFKLFTSAAYFTFSFSIFFCDSKLSVHWLIASFIVSLSSSFSSTISYIYTKFYSILCFSNFSDSSRAM